MAATVVIAGAGIGGLTAALALAQRGFRVTLLEAAPRLEEIGAGVQLSPNASRVLIALGLTARLKPNIVAPEELTIRSARTAGVLARGPLGTAAAQRYGAPFWVIHRGDLQMALRDAVAAMPEIDLQLGVRAIDFAVRDDAIALTTSGRQVEARGMALIAADGLWSVLRRRLGHQVEPHFAHHTAWRALVPADAMPPALAGAAVNLWLGRDGHLVHYPIRAGRMINVVAIVRDDWQDSGWSSPGSRAELLDRFSADLWHASARELLSATVYWQKWALADCAPLAHWGTGRVTLLGDAAHPMLPFLAQGAAMAIEDAAVLAASLTRTPDDATSALRSYERMRIPRTTRTQGAARRNTTAYHMGGVQALVRALALRAMGGDRLIRHYDWLYGWTPP